MPVTVHTKHGRKWITTQGAVILTGLAPLHLDYGKKTGLLEEDKDWTTYEDEGGLIRKLYSTFALVTKRNELIYNLQRYYGRTLDKPRVISTDQMEFLQ